MKKSHPSLKTIFLTLSIVCTVNVAISAENPTTNNSPTTMRPAPEASIKATKEDKNAKVTKEEAVTMVKSGMAYLKANGKEKAAKEINDQHGMFVNKELYLILYTLDGLALAHGANSKMAGKNMIDVKDLNGKEFYRERQEIAKTKKSFWQDYVYVNPITRKAEPKSAYCEVDGNLIICGGIYK